MCDSNHARIKRAKKTSDIPVRIPRAWADVVSCARGKFPMVTHEMKKEEPLDWSEFSF